ncbi:MAG TPA: ABC transporter ATP-binding protein [Gemmatimonadales bacterium]
MQPVAQVTAASRVAAAPLVTLRGLSKRFPVRRGWKDTLLRPRNRRLADVLQNVSFDVAPGELFGLLGPNGAGKTTIFKILSTLVTPDRGTVEIAGHDLVREPAQVREVITPVVVDERSLNWRLSAVENLRVYGALHGLHGARLLERIGEVLALVELDGVGPKMVGQYSSGMRQRLLIARALLHRPRVLLLDEPTRSLDPISARQFRALLRDEIVGRQQCTVLLATHNPEEALTYCDRVAILNRGRVVTVERPQVLARQLVGSNYRVWTHAPHHPAFQELVREGRLSGAAVASDETGRSVVDIRAVGQGEEVADVLSTLVMRGVPITRFEQASLGLADLIEKAIAATAGEWHA